MIKENYDKCESCGLYKHIEYREEGIYYCTDCWEENNENCSEDELNFDDE